MPDCPGRDLAWVDHPGVMRYCEALRSASRPAAPGAHPAGDIHGPTWRRAEEWLAPLHGARPSV